MGKLLKAYLMPHPPIMVHEVGRGEEEKIERTISSAVEVAEDIERLKPDTIIIVVPPHGPSFSDAMNINSVDTIAGDLGNFGAGQVKLEYKVDTELVDIILKNASARRIPAVPVDKEKVRKYRVLGNLDHGALVPLYFINKKYKEFKLVHITYGLLPSEELYDFGRQLRESIEESSSNTVLLFSGDLSHRLTPDAPAGFSPKGEKFDRALVGHLSKPETQEIMDMDRDLVEAAGECGYRSILVLLGSMDGLDVKGRVLSYEGPFGVGYCIAEYEMLGENPANAMVNTFYEKRGRKIKDLREKEDEYVKLARASLENYLKTGRTLKVPDSVPEEMLRERAGTFVSIKKNGELRGCIGTIEGVQKNIAEEIIENAISSGTRDPRFYPVEEDELEKLEYSVDVLGKAEPIESKSRLDVKRYGVIVRKGFRSGLLLPNLEGVDSVDEQVDIALKKAGIGRGESYTLERFEVIRHR